MTNAEPGRTQPQERSARGDVTTGSTCVGVGRDGAIGRAGWLIVLSFWAVQFVELTLAAFITDGPRAWQSLLPRCVVLIVGVALSLASVGVSRHHERLPFRKRMVWTLATALAAGLALAALNFAVFRALVWERGMAEHPADYVYTALSWSWFFLTMACATLALSYGAEVRDKDDRLTRMEAAAKDAQLLALRYQLNPHFLFNALNSVAALVAGEDCKAAEATVENLSDFLRAGLEIEPREEITLAREMELQAMYLAVEQIRFGERLVVGIDVPEALRDALVPALILQPLVENAMRHAVAGTTACVSVTLSASREDDRLVISVVDDARPDPARGRRGTGLGLVNVRARLSAHYGRDHSFAAGPGDGVGFAARVFLPLRRG